MDIRIKSINDPIEASDGVRVLVDDWLPAGLDEYKVHANMWIKDLAPSGRLRRFRDENPGNWYDYENACIKEMSTDKDLSLNLILERAMFGTVTLLYSQGDEYHNNAICVRDCILASREEFVPNWVERTEKKVMAAATATTEEDWQAALREAA